MRDKLQRYDSIYHQTTNRGEENGTQKAKEFNSDHNCRRIQQQTEKRLQTPPCWMPIVGALLCFAPIKKTLIMVVLSKKDGGWIHGMDRMAFFFLLFFLVTSSSIFTVFLLLIMITK